MAVRDVPHRDDGSTVPRRRCRGFAHSLRRFWTGGLWSVNIDAARFLPAILAGRWPSWTDNFGRANHIPVLIVSGVVCVVLGTLCAGFWVARLIESIEFHFLGER